MNLLSNNFLQNQLEEDKREFIKLKGRTFAKYKIIYHINDCFHIDDLSRFSIKHQLLFQKFESREQQINLMYVDSIFPIILADLALDVFLQKVYSFHDYLSSEKSIFVSFVGSSNLYFRHKIVSFIKLLAYSDISEEKYSKGKIDSEKIFCIKDELGSTNFYTIYDQHKLVDLLVDKMKLEIDLKSSFISKTEVSLYLKIFMN